MIPVTNCNMLKNSENCRKILKNTLKIQYFIDFFGLV